MRYSLSAIIFSIAFLTGMVLTGCSSADQPAVEPPEGTNRDSVTIELTANDSISPLDLLMSEHKVDYQSSMMGAFVKSIDSVENSSSAYWVYSVNDTTPKIACDKMILQPGDRMVWHLRKVTPPDDSDTIE